MSALDDVRRAMREMKDVPSCTGPLRLYVGSALFDLGEAECRRVCGVGADVEIVENPPIRITRSAPKPQRRYPASLRKTEN